MCNMLEEAIYFWICTALLYMTCAFMWCGDVINSHRMVGLFVIILLTMFRIMDVKDSKKKA